MPSPLPVQLSSALRFRLRKGVEIEDFGERSVVLLCDSLRLREINGLSRRLLALLDGSRTVQDIVRTVADEFGTPVPETEAHVAEALLEMERQGIAQRMVTWSTESPQNMSDARYLANPDVSFRQEDDDGGILFNADTEALEVINPTAVEIWLFLAAPHTQDEVVDHLCSVCDGATEEQVQADVAAFLESLLAKGFVGVVEDEG
jgi:hypothetical protein